MKKLIFFCSLHCLAGGVFSQTLAQPYDSSFKELYKEVALHAGYKNSRGVIHDSVVRKWDKDITIFVEGGATKSRKEILARLKSTIAVISPALDNKIKISFTGEKTAANYVINLSTIWKSGWFLKWDAQNNIYSCVTVINTRVTFNVDQQAALVSHYFLRSLGDFVITRNAPAVVSNIRLWRQDINDIDLQILKLHYSDDIKSGMAEKDIDNYFANNQSPVKRP